MRIQNAPKNDWNGEILTRIRCLSLIEAVGSESGCVLKVCDVPSAPNLISLSFGVPSSQCCISNFKSIRHKLCGSFRATLKGVITDLEGLDYSQSGNPKRDFNLVDGQGSYISCCAMKHNAESISLQNFQEVVIFFGTGRGPKGSYPGKFYLMKEAFMFPIGGPRLLSAPKNDHLEIE